jgi:hypothetical protein
VTARAATTGSLVEDLLQGHEVTDVERTGQFIHMVAFSR